MTAPRKILIWPNYGGKDSKMAPKTKQLEFLIKICH